MASSSAALTVCGVPSSTGSGTEKSRVPSATLLRVRVWTAVAPVSSVSLIESGLAAMSGAPRVVAEAEFTIGPGLPNSSSARTAKK